MTVLATIFVLKIVNWPGFWPLLTVVVSLLAVVASLLAARIGGHIAGKYALLAQQQAAVEARQRDREIERQALAGTLRAIEAELKVHKRALEHLSDRLRETPADWPLATG
jgi:hypothetical protein